MPCALGLQTNPTKNSAPQIERLLGLREACGERGGEEGLKDHLRKYPVAQSQAVMLRKVSIADAWLATIHGFPDNMAVCQDLIKPYNADKDRSVIPGRYYCEPIR